LQSSPHGIVGCHRPDGQRTPWQDDDSGTPPTRSSQFSKSTPARPRPRRSSSGDPSRSRPLGVVARLIAVEFGCTSGRAHCVQRPANPAFPGCGVRPTRRRQVIAAWRVAPPPRERVIWMRQRRGTWANGIDELACQRLGSVGILCAESSANHRMRNPEGERCLLTSAGSP
jgi:hypothetical protein